MKVRQQTGRQTLLLRPVGWRMAGWVGDGVDGEILALGDHQITERSREVRGSATLSLK